MAAAGAVLNIAMGIVYVSIGSLVLAEMVRARRTMGFSHFGAAVVALAFTCGPFHFAQGIHLGFEGREANPAELIAVAVGFPAGLAWFLLRAEAIRGGRGDRKINGNPAWIMLMPTAAGVYLTSIVWAAAVAPGAEPALGAVIPNLTLVALYSAIAYLLVGTQLANRRLLGGWSLSGLALAGTFVTCSAMHFVYFSLTFAGAYSPDVHGTLAAWVSMPAAAYFLWVVRALNRGTYHDWNGAPWARRGALAKAAPHAVQAARARAEASG